MPTLLAPPPPPPARTEPPAVPFLGRTFAEYTRCFALDPLAWRRRAVLDVAAGPSSFTAEAVRRGIEAVAVDAWYDRPAGLLAAQARADCRRLFAEMRARPGGFGRRSFTAIDATEADRRAAVRRFLADYDNNVRHGRYVRASLPALPFLDQGFSLVLCARPLFTAGFDHAWRLAACLELVRVTAGEARLHPLGARSGAELARLCADLAAHGVRSDLVPVEDKPGGGKNMLVLRRDRTLRPSVAA